MKTTLITVLAVIASVTAEPYIYGSSLLAPAAPYTQAAAYPAPAFPAAYPAAYSAAYPGAYPAAYTAAYPAAYSAAYSAGFPATYPAYPAPLPVSPLTAYGSSYSVEELAPLVSSASAPLLYGSPYSPIASYVYGR